MSVIMSLLMRAVDRNTRRDQILQTLLRIRGKCFITGTRY